MYDENLGRRRGRVFSYRACLRILNEGTDPPAQFTQGG